MFKSATIKLTAWYLALMMGVSLAFSFVLYRASYISLISGFEHQRATIRQEIQDFYGLNSTPFALDKLRDSELNNSQRRLLADLTLANLGVLVVGGAASFYLARRTLRPIEQSMEAQARFTADASHELRTPLTAMQTEIEVALRDHDLSTKEARDLLQSNLEEVAKLQALSNSLLTLANQDKDGFVAEPRQILPIVAAAVERTAKAAEAKHISIENKVGDLRVLGDRDSLVQLLSVLLDNAVKYSPDKSSITLTSQAKGGTAYISVTDTGDGIHASDLPHIFDRLYRADTSRTKSESSGYGLGLSIAKKIVELHKGAIDVTTKVGAGTTFTVRLPLIESKETKKPEA